jgi:hypothetical protein
MSALNGDLFHSVGGLLVLLIPLVLNIYKPRGLTRYGWRRQHEQAGGHVGHSRTTTRPLTR